MQKTPQKNTNYLKNETIYKIGHLGRLEPMQSIRPLQNGLFGSKIINANNMLKPFYKNIRVVVCKKPFEKTSNIQEMRRF